MKQAISQHDLTCSVGRSAFLGDIKRGGNRNENKHNKTNKSYTSKLFFLMKQKTISELHPRGTPDRYTSTASSKHVATQNTHSSKQTKTEVYMESFETLASRVRHIGINQRPACRPQENSKQRSKRQNKTGKLGGRRQTSHCSRTPVDPILTPRVDQYCVSCLANESRRPRVRLEL